jgi:hypothetical protein
MSDHHPLISGLTLRPLHDEPSWFKSSAPNEKDLLTDSESRIQSVQRSEECFLDRLLNTVSRNAPAVLLSVWVASASALWSSVLVIL